MISAEAFIKKPPFFYAVLLTKMIEMWYNKMNIFKEKVMTENIKYIYINTFGCQQNEADSETLLGIAESKGYKETNDIEKASLILFNTCAVREHAELKALSITGQMKHLKEKNKSLKIGICGCMVQQDHRKEDIKNKYPYVDFVFGTNMISKFGDILDEIKDSKKRKFFIEDYSENHGDITEGLPVSRKYDYKAYVSIMYGCNNFCTYCIVPYVRGRERSRKAECIIEEVKGLVAGGCKEIMLLGQNVNSYGKDLENGIEFPELLERLCKIEGDFTIKFMTSHPKDATHHLIDIIAANEKCERHFHLPIQSGSNDILKKMNRKYKIESIFEICDYMREKIPDILITTDIIVGFPGETEKDFSDTLKALERCRFDGVFSFVYSPRKGTPAEKMDGRIDQNTAKDRMGRLLDIQQAIQLEKNKKYVGEILTALCEGESKSSADFFSARTSSGKLIHFPKTECDLAGKQVRIRIKEAKAIMLIGELVQ